MKLKYNRILCILSITNRWYILRPSSAISLCNFKEKSIDDPVNSPGYNTDDFSIFKLIKRDK